MDLNQEAKLLKDVEQLGALLNTLHEKMKEKPNDAVYKAELEKVAEAASLALEKKYFPRPENIKFGQDGDIKSLGQFLSMVKNNDPKVAGFKTTEQSEGTPADGGYSVPGVYDSAIIEAEQNAAIILPLCKKVGMSQNTLNFSSQLTQPSVSWIAEKGKFGLTKITLGRVTLTLKKVGAIVPFTAELLNDTISDITGLVNKSVGVALAREIDRVILAGSTVGGDPFNGIINGTGVNSTTSSANTTYDNIVDCMNSITLEKYQDAAQWYLNRFLMKVVMKIKNNQGDPIFLMPSQGNGFNGSLLGKPYKMTDIIPATTTSTLLYGSIADAVLVGQPAKNSGITVDASNSAVVTDADGKVTQNSFENDETMFRFKQRIAIDVPIGSAMAKLITCK